MINFQKPPLQKIVRTHAAGGFGACLLRQCYLLDLWPATGL